MLQAIQPGAELQQEALPCSLVALYGRRKQNPVESGDQLAQQRARYRRRLIHDQPVRMRRISVSQPLAQRIRCNKVHLLSGKLCQHVGGGPGGCGHDSIAVQMTKMHPCQRRLAAPARGGHYHDAGRHRV